MNTKIAGLVIGILIILLGVGGYFFLNNSSKKQAPVVNTASQATSPSVSATQSSIKSLLASKTPKQCDFSDNVGTASFTGTVYVADGKASGEFNVQTQAGPIVSHMISDGTNAYIWTGNTKQGFKFSLAAATNAAGNTQNSQSVDVNKTFDFKCKDWSVDNSKFAIPTDVTFTAFAIPNTSPAVGSIKTTTGSSAACSACNSVPAGEQRTACLTALHCQ
jgi:hypothetical protein